MHPRLRQLLIVGSVIAAFMLLQSSFGIETARGFDYSKLNAIQKRILSGFASFELAPQTASHPSARLRNYTPHGSGDCVVNLGSNIKVNQNCLNVTDTNPAVTTRAAIGGGDDGEDAALEGRGQAENETSIAQDPLQPNHVVASYNDYRRGDGNCYAAWSVNGGRTWNDSTVPMSFTLGNPFGAARQYWQAGGDTAVAWDTKGNAYLQCQVFMRGQPTSPNPDVSSAVYVFRSTQNFGASFNFPGRPVIESADTTGSGGAPFEDKPYMTVDNHVGSPYQDRVYVAYTEFAADGSAYIWESHSSDYGETFSPRVLVSKDSSLCPNNYGVGTPYGNCNENQFAQPFTGPDGALYIVFNNYNNTVTGNDNRNQFLLAKSTDGGNTFSAPVKVADYYDLPDCFTYQGQDFGRSCVPEKGASTNSYFRATNYASGAVNPTNASQVVVTFGSYINSHSNETNGCTPTGFSPATGANLYTGVKTAGACNNDILVSVSSNGGASFTGTATDPRSLTSVTQAPGQATTDQFWQWAAFTKTGKFAVSYYDRQYGTDETTGFSDVSLSGSGTLSSFGVQRATSASMPPPTEFSGLFYGDYSGLTAVDNAMPLWMDTRGPELFTCPGSPPSICTSDASNAAVANDQDIYVANMAVPSK